MPVNFDSVSVAPSPRSSSATLIWSAARTKPSTSSSDDLPSRPASCASLFSSSRLVRVSIFLNDSFRLSTWSFVIPVYFCTFVISWAMAANASTELPMPLTNRVTAPMAATMPTCHACMVDLTRAQPFSCSPTTVLTFWSSALTAAIFRLCSSHAALPRSMSLS